MSSPEERTASRVRLGVATWKVTRAGEREREVKDDTVMARGRVPEAEVQMATLCGRRRIMCRSCSPIGRDVEGEECGWMLGRRCGREDHSAGGGEEDLCLVWPAGKRGVGK